MVYIIVIMTPAHFVMEGKTPYFYPNGTLGKKMKLQRIKKTNLEIPISLLKNFLGPSFKF